MDLRAGLIHAEEALPTRTRLAPHLFNLINLLHLADGRGMETR